MRKTKVFALVIAIVTMVSSFAFVANAQETIRVNVDGSALNMDVSPVNENGRVLVPFRFIAEALGGVVGWDESTKTVSIQTADKNIALVVGDTTAKINGQLANLDVPAKVLDGRTLVPVRFVSESLGAKVNWNSASNTVEVNYFSTMTGTLKIGGSTTVQPVSQASADYLMKNANGLSVTVTGGGSGVGIAGAKDGTLNIGMSSSDLKQADLDAGLVPIKVGKDAIVVIANKSNPVKALTRKQMRDIFAGEIKNWQDVGGNNAPIIIHTRESGSGTLDGFVSLVMKKEKSVLAIAEPHSSNQLVKQAITQDANSIGFISLGYLDTTITGLTADGVIPSEATAAAGQYPFVRSLYLATKGQPSVQAAMFINFVRSTKGQQLLAASDYIPIR